MEIRIKDLTKTYGSYTAVDAKELSILSGESFGLVGNNGAGKTTLFRSILDLIEPDTGTVQIGDFITKSSEDWKDFTGSYLDENFIVGHLLPEEYFDFVASLHGMSQSGKKLIRDLSKGNQKKVGIAAALLFDPSVLILDEPFANLDPSTQIRLKDLLKKLKEDKGVTMLISSHDLQHIIEVCERIVLLEKGQVINDIQTSPATLKELEDYFAGVGHGKTELAEEQAS